MRVEPLPQFRRLTEAAVTAALDDPDDPVAREVARLLAGYLQNLRLRLELEGPLPRAAQYTAKGSCPIEAVALRLMTDVLQVTASIH